MSLLGIHLPPLHWLDLGHGAAQPHLSWAISSSAMYFSPSLSLQRVLQRGGQGRFPGAEEQAKGQSFLKAILSYQGTQHAPATSSQVVETLPWLWSSPGALQTGTCGWLGGQLRELCWVIPHPGPCAVHGCLPGVTASPDCYAHQCGCFPRLWCLLLCSSCAATGTHRRCSALKDSTVTWECDSCAGLGTGKRRSWVFQWVPFMHWVG